MSARTLYLIRHAQSAPSLEAEESQWPLSDLGRRQADVLAGLLVSLDIDRLYSGPYLRARQTIEPFATRRATPVSIEAGLGERRLTKDALAQFADVWQRSWADLVYAPSGRESPLDAQRRFVDAVRRILKAASTGTIAACSHGGVIGLFLRHLDGKAGRERAEALRNPDVLRIDVSGERGPSTATSRFPGLPRLPRGASEASRPPEGQRPERAIERFRPLRRPTRPSP